MYRVSIQLSCRSNGAAVTVAVQAYDGGKKIEAQAAATYGDRDHISACCRLLRMMSMSTRFDRPSGEQSEQRPDSYLGTGGARFSAGH